MNRLALSFLFLSLASALACGDIADPEATSKSEEAQNVRVSWTNGTTCANVACPSNAYCDMYIWTCQGFECEAVPACFASNPSQDDMNKCAAQSCNWGDQCKTVCWDDQCQERLPACLPFAASEPVEPPAPCYNVCSYGAHCSDYCPSRASCRKVADPAGNYWEVLGCGR